MDIFTTVLTRVVPVPIKPANLKVKALLKSADLGKLKEDLDHLENHDNYFVKKNSEKEPSNKKQDNEQKNEKDIKDDSQGTDVEPSESENKYQDEKQPDNTNEVITESKDGTKHLDIYI